MRLLAKPMRIVFGISALIFAISVVSLDHSRSLAQIALLATLCLLILSGAFLTLLRLGVLIERFARFVPQDRLDENGNNDLG
jgi:hypothetical protein